MLKALLPVEGNPNDELLIKRALKKNHVANKIVVAHDGLEALDYLFRTGMYKSHDRRGMTRVILLDLKLPCVDGLEVL